MSEKYDEVVFTNPKAEFHHDHLVGGNVRKELPYPLLNEPSVMEHFRTYGDEGEMKAMLEAKRFLEGELCNVMERLLRVDVELEEAKWTLSAVRGLNAASTAIKGTVDVGGNAVGGLAGGGGTNAGNAVVKPPKVASASTSDSQPAGKKARSS